MLRAFLATTLVLSSSLAYATVYAVVAHLDCKDVSPAYSLPGHVLSFRGNLLGGQYRNGRIEAPADLSFGTYPHSYPGPLHPDDSRREGHVVYQRQYSIEKVRFFWTNVLGNVHSVDLSIDLPVGAKFGKATGTYTPPFRHAGQTRFPVSCFVRGNDY